MNTISCRANFTDVDAFAPELRISTGTGVPCVDCDPSAARDSFLMVHGFHREAKDILDAYRSNCEMMREAPMTDMGVFQPSPIGFMWPSLGGGLIQGLEFHRAIAQANLSAEWLAKIIVAGAPRVIMAHSLGARVTLKALQLAYAQSPAARVTTVALIGPAVNDDVFSPSGEFADIGPAVGRVLVFWSNRDHVVHLDYEFDQLHRGLGARGPAPGSPPWVVSCDVTATVADHGGYRHDRVGVWQRIAQELG